MEKDIEGGSHWYDLTPGKWVQGLVAHWDNERRVYVVTITPEMEDAATRPLAADYEWVVIETILMWDKSFLLPF